MTTEPLVEGALPGLYADLVATIGLFCGDQRAAEDVAQEALIATWQRRTQVTDPRAWAFRFAFNTVKSTFRRRAAERRALSRMSRERPAIVDPLAALELNLDLRRRITGLPKRQRQAVLLHYLADLDATQAAQVMGCSAGAVKAHLARALAALRRGGFSDQPDVEERQRAGE